MITSQQPSDRGVAGEAVARRDPDERHEAAEPREVVEREAVEARRRPMPSVSPGPPAAAFGEEHDREAAGARRARTAGPSSRGSTALRAGEDGVVVRHRDDRVAVDRADAADEPVGRRALDELLERAAAALRGDDERRVLDEGAVVDEVGDVLARGAAPGRRGAARRRRAGGGRARRRGGRGPRRDRGARDRGRRRRDASPLPAAPTSRALSIGSSASPGMTVVPTPTAIAVDHAGDVGGDDVLHLHRLEHDELLPGAHLVALADVDRDDRALHRRGDDVHRVFLAELPATRPRSGSAGASGRRRRGSACSAARRRARSSAAAGAARVSSALSSIRARCAPRQ